MSERAAKDVRRQVRRTVGVEAVAIIERHSAILHQTVLPSLNTQAAALESHELQLAANHAEHEQFVRRSLWQRLRWLVRGADE